MGAFWSESENYEDGPIETINTTLFTVWVKEVEKDMFLCLILSHENLYTDNADKFSTLSISNFEGKQGVFKEEDTVILNHTMKLYYDLFCLFHFSFRKVLERSQRYLEGLLEDFTSKFEKYYFKDACGRTYFNNVVFRGFPICPLDSKLYLYAQKYAHSMDVSKTIIFIKEYFVYGNIPTEEAEILHAYLIGPLSEQREGYISNWTDSSLQGNTIKVPRKRVKNSSSRATDSEFEEEKLNHTDINYEECFDDEDSYTDFWRINKAGFVGKGKKKEGFIVGPSVFKKIDKDNIEDLKTYEIHAPSIFIKESWDSQKTMWKLIILTFRQMTFVYLLENHKLEEHEYTLMYERTKVAAETLTKKIEPVLNFYTEDYLRNNSKVKFYYFNETNLAVKYSPSVSIEILTTEMRHFFNLIKEKFDENEELKEYKVTTSDFWMVGVKSLTRLVIILIPASFSYPKMEKEKSRILKKYFSQFIF